MKVNVYKMVIEVLDFENQGLDDIIESIENNKYLVVKVREQQVREVNDWFDEHPLNKTSTAAQAFNDLFKE
jgi:hypothetical protein